MTYRQEPTEPPAHRRGVSRVARHEHDRASMLARLPFVAAAALAALGMVALGRVGSGPGGDDRAGARPAAPGLAMPALAPAGTASSTWYCAAGTAEPGGPADQEVVLANPSGTDRHATLTVMAGALSGPGRAPAPAVPAPAVRALTVPAGQRVAVRLAEVVVAPLAAAVVEVDGGDVAVEHRVTGPDGSDTGPCAAGAAADWHLAWGTTTRDARDLVVLFNPFPSAATVDASFVTEEGDRAPVRWQGFPVPARSVVGVDLGDDVTRSRQVAASFRARTGRIVVERLESFDASLGVRGLSLDLAVPRAATTWVFADGAATAPTPRATEPAPSSARAKAAPRPGLAASEKIVVYNPGPDRAEVDVQAVPGAGSVGPPPQPFRLSVPGGGYDIVDYGAEPRVAPGAPHATVVRSTNGVPVVAERLTVDVVTPKPKRVSARTQARHPAASRPDPATGETTVTPGSLLASPDWTFGAVGGTQAATVIVVYNPDPDRPVAVHLLSLGAAAFAGPDGAAGALTSAEVPPGGQARLTVPAGTDAARVGVVVRADAPVVAERLVRTADGRRLALAPGLPARAGARPLDQLVPAAGGRDDR